MYLSSFNKIFHFSKWYAQNLIDYIYTERYEGNLKHRGLCSGMRELFLVTSNMSK